jgi:hypothetical protein
MLVILMMEVRSTEFPLSVFLLNVVCFVKEGFKQMSRPTQTNEREGYDRSTTDLSEHPMARWIPEIYQERPDGERRGLAEKLTGLIINATVFLPLIIGSAALSYVLGTWWYIIATSIWIWIFPSVDFIKKGWGARANLSAAIINALFTWLYFVPMILRKDPSQFYFVLFALPFFTEAIVSFIRWCLGYRSTPRERITTDLSNEEDVEPGRPSNDAVTQPGFSISIQIGSVKSDSQPRNRPDGSRRPRRRR